MSHFWLAMCSLTAGLNLAFAWDDLVGARPDAAMGAVSAVLGAILLGLVIGALLTDRAEGKR